MRCIEDLTWLLAHALTPTFRQCLCEIMGRTVLLGGILLYDMGLYTKARQQYQIASQAAGEAGSSLLQAVVWGWTSFTWTYSQDYQKALRCVQYAYQLAALTPNTLVQAWLEAITAEIQAHLLNQDECIQSLNFFERYMHALPFLETSYLFEFNPVLLLGYKGVCLQQFYQKNKSETYIFLREAKEALKHALASNAPLKRKIYL